MVNLVGVDFVELRQFSQTFWVHACVKTIIDEICGLDWDIICKEGFSHDKLKERIEEVKQFLKYPNSNGENFNHVFVRQLLKDILELDAGVLNKVFSMDSYDFDRVEPKSGGPLLKPLGERKLKEIYCRDGASFLMEGDKFGYVRGHWQYSYQIPAHPMWFNKDEISYTMETPRSTSFYGYARTQAILDIIKSLHYSTIYNKKYFEETGMPDGVLALIDTNESEMQSMMDMWIREFKAQPHKFAVVNKDIEWKQLSLPNTELQFLETQKQYFNFVIAMFGLTPMELGLTEDVSGKSVSGGQAELTKRKGIRPFLKLLENTINKDILPEFMTPGIEFTFIYDDPQEMAVKLNNWKIQMDMGVITPNEVRRELGLDPIEGGDVARGSYMMQGQDSENKDKMGAQDGARDGPKEKPKEDLGTKEKDKPEKSGMQDDNKKLKQDQKERDESVEDPYSMSNRPVGSFRSTSVNMKKGKYLQMSVQELIEEHQNLVRILEGGNKSELMQEAQEQKKELEGYIQEINKHFSEKKNNNLVGQYYNDEEVIQDNRGLITQPQNDREIFAPELGSDHRTGQSYVSDHQHEMDLSCPVCGKPTLHLTTSADDINQTPMYDCIDCGATFREEELFNFNNFNELDIENSQRNPYSGPVEIPSWSPKGIKEDFTCKEYCNFDYTKFMQNIENFALSEEYKKMLEGYLKDLSKEKVSEIINILHEGILMNQTITQMARQIEKIVGDRHRAMLISRTETIRITNEGNISKYKERGIKKLEWVSAPDDNRLCEECQKMNGKIFTVENAKGKIPAHCHCRCSFTEAIDFL